MISILPVFAVGTAQMVAGDSKQPRDGHSVLRGANSASRMLPGKKAQGGSKGKGARKDEGDDKGGDGDDGGDDLKNPKREPTGEIILSRKSVKSLKKAGKKPDEIAKFRNKGLSMIKEQSIVFESVGDHDFQVVAVGKGNEETLMRNIENGANRDLFEFAEMNYHEHIVETTSNDPLLANQYHHLRMQSKQAWDLSTGSAGVTVAICDTGLELNHPDLEGNTLLGYQATTQKWEADGGLVSAVHPHGTQCAGCAAALGNNTVGVSGVGWNFKHRPGRVSDSSGGGSSSAVLADCAK